jgi:hypothetical protein
LPALDLLARGRYGALLLLFVLPERISSAGYKAREAPEIPQKEKYGKRTMHDDRKDRKLIKCWFCSSPDKEVFHAVKAGQRTEARAETTGRQRISVVYLPIRTRLKSAAGA